MQAEQYVWFSRLSFGAALLGLLSSVLGGCQSEPNVSPEQLEQQAELPAPVAETPKPPSDSDVAIVTPRPEPSEHPDVEAPVAPKPPEQAPEEPAARAELHVERLIVTNAVENREPVESDTITAGEEPVIAFIELKNPSDADGQITVTFEQEGGPKVGHVELAVPANSSRWRTWGQTRMIKSDGDWTAVVRDQDGQELGRTPFTVQQAS